MAGGIDVVGMRTAIDIDHSGIFLGRVKVGGKDEAIVEVGHPVSSLDGACLDFWHLEVFPRVISHKIAES